MGGYWGEDGEGVELASGQPAYAEHGVAAGSGGAAEGNTHTAFEVRFREKYGDEVVYHMPHDEAHSVEEEGDGAGETQAADPDRWACPQCTYRNRHAAHNGPVGKCAMCAAPRPPPDGPESGFGAAEEAEG